MPQPEDRYVEALKKIAKKGMIVDALPSGKVLGITRIEDARIAKQALGAEHLCRDCEGDGRIANSDSGEPWAHWLSLPLHSATAVALGLVFPVLCRTCGGTGIRP